MVSPEEPEEAKSADSDDFRDLKEAIHNAISEFMKEKTAPAVEINERLKDFLDMIHELYTRFPRMIAEPLDKYFPIDQLKKVPSIVERVKSLSNFRVGSLPNEKVGRYSKQAITCHIYGLYSAAAALSRATLELGLEEVIGHRIPRPSNPSSRETLENLINCDRRIRLLEPDMAGKADNIRRIENKAIHQDACSQPEALNTIKDMVEILKHIHSPSSRPESRA